MSLGRRDAAQRLAHLFCELEVRLGMVGLAGDGRYDLALTQTDLAECLGLSPVHMNRTVQHLRREGLAEFCDGRVHLPDQARIRRFAEFDVDYLYPGRQPQ